MKSKLLKIACLSAALLLTGCDSIKATPKNANDALITFNDGSVYFQNNYQKVYDGLVDSDTYSTLTFDALLNKIIEKKVYAKGDNGKAFFQDIDTLIPELVAEKLLEKVNSDSYKTDSLFSETKFLNTVNASLYGISVATPHEDIMIKPDTTIEELLGEDYKTVYKSYIDNEILPEINKNLLTARYIIEHSFSSLGRAYARKISYVKLENMSKKPGAASELITKWLGDFIKEGKTTTLVKDEEGNDIHSFDLDSLARIYKGVSYANDLEKAYDTDEYYTLSNEISDEIAKIADYDEQTGTYTMKLDIDIDKTIEDKYTSSGSYTLAWGHELANRTLSAKKISDTGLFTKTTGISDLPSSVTDRLFSSSVSSYLSTAYYMEDGTNPYKVDDDGNQTKEPKDGAIKVQFLAPLTSENGSDLSNYYFFDSEKNAYYIVVVEDYQYTTTQLKNADKKHVTLAGEENSTIIGVDNDVARIALDLASSSSYSSDAILDVLKEFEISTNIHDQTFYDYMKTTYADIFE